TNYVGTTSSKFGASPRDVYQVFGDDNNDVHLIKCQLPASGSSYWNTSDTGGAEVNCSWSDQTPNPNNLTRRLEAFATAGGDTYDKTKFAGFNYQWTNSAGTYLHF